MAELVYALLEEGTDRPAAIITDQQVADEWAASSAKRDYIAYKVDDYTEGWLNTIQADPEQSNHGKETARPEVAPGLSPLQKDYMGRS